MAYGPVNVPGGAGDTSENVVKFSQASKRENIQTGEKHGTLFGKIAKWFADLKTVAFSGSYNDLSHKPDIPAAVRVKGSAESAYRTGDVNITAANVGAAASNHNHDSAYAAKSHSHSNYAALSHTHTYLPLSGGEMSGGIKQKGSLPFFEFCHPSKNIKTSIWANFSDQINHSRLAIQAEMGSETAGVAIDSYDDAGKSKFFLPDADGKINLGSSNCRWKDIYSVNSSIITSDRNKKMDFREFDDDFIIKFINGLNAVSYKLKENESGRRHYGLIAQDVEGLLERLGMTGTDFAVFIKSPKYETVYKEAEWTDENGSVQKQAVPERQLIAGEYDYGLRYEEFIAPVIKFVQILYDKNVKQQKEIDDLKKKISGLTEPA